MRFAKMKIALLVCVAMSTLLTACGGASSTSSSDKPTVTFMTWESNNTNVAIDSALAKMNDSSLTIKRLPTPSTDFDQKITSLTTAKSLPDFFWCGNDTEQALGAQGVLFDWSSYISKTTADFDQKNFAPEAVKNWYSADGSKLYGLPTLMNTYGYFYNADLFTAANVPLPKAGWTYDDMFAAAKTLTKTDGSQPAAVGGPYTDPFLISNYALSAGGSSFTDRVVSPTKVTTDAKFVEGTQKFVDGLKAGYFTAPNANTGTDTAAAFLTGKVPMLWGGQWLAASFMTANPSFKIGFAPLPIVSKQVHIYDAVGVCSPSYIKNPDAVWKVITYLDTKGWNDILPSAPVAPAAYVPASNAYYDTLKAKNLGSVADSVAYALNAPQKDAVRFIAPWSTKANDVITANWNDILMGKKPVQSTLNTMTQQINDVIKQNS
ncbi:ABC transporter substrate-binding protein [Tengunoibacter tsumagoiensis]|uniref:Sugar ABC transporter substrate-binding protein n=1 Tax=Tengunoibacter tsumagoiensis TaxID=2014871 RepID=A0A401ZTS2_9CHLR|nr:extracellular solute-binding protein [Tengunoibacter tsumagoiensis]GCE10196.1 hypothetical protein KTT_00550 [Tengunoibacter tsumagoiensis]